jgi:uncharacterized protein
MGKSAQQVGLEEARGWYAEAETAHDFDHVVRVWRLAERIAREENADLEIIRAAALLHDVRGALAGEEIRSQHHLLSAEFAGKMLAKKGWEEERIQAVQYCIRMHRFRGNGEIPATLEARILFDADKLDVIGAIGTARTIAYAASAGEPIYAQPSKTFLVTGKKEPGESHSAYHEYLFKLKGIKDCLFTPAAKRIAETRHAFLVEFFERLAAEVNGEA